jgi:hypothetical protein
LGGSLDKGLPASQSVHQQARQAGRQAGRQAESQAEKQLASKPVYLADKPARQCTCYLLGVFS